MRFTDVGRALLAGWYRSMDLDPRLHKKEKVRIGQMAQCIIVLAPLAKDLGLVP